MKGALSMPNRILLCVSAMLSSLVLFATFDVARAADDCLTGPNKATPQGGHWYYHIERGTGRKCWYLGEETAKTSAAKSEATSPDAETADTADADATEPAPVRPAAKITPSLERAAADRPRRAARPKPEAPPAPAAQVETPKPANNNARAEFVDTSPAGQPEPAAPTPSPLMPQSAPTPAPPVATEITGALGPVGTRWPSPGTTFVADNTPAAMNPPPAAASPPPAAPSVPQVATTPETKPAAAPAAEQVSAAAAIEPDAADGPDYLLYALIASAFAFCGVVAWAGLRYAIAWWQDYREEQRWQRAASLRQSGGALLTIGNVPMGLEAAGEPRPRRAVSRAPALEEEPPRRLEDEIDEIEQLLALTRRSDVPPPGRYAPWDREYTARDAAE
jgi:hypothetical protein